MVDVDQAAPADIVDRLLWRDAQQMLGRHSAARDGNCVWCGCRWPCSARRLAERAEIVARRPWREAWTLRHDINSMRTGYRSDHGYNDSSRRYTA
ncbi:MULTISPECIES: hypothetical protein [Actinoplanes]|uniref:hypothetical protein n=1 Tax=Actinoplanes TaxID=1865 RepID=UPI0005F2C769|nr:MULTISPECIES: hypothetical protein [Actinoplanes]GLY01105.1 hypothetical protein Acsp01_14840 [Actinoplanes sp. NBRC 101535]